MKKSGLEETYLEIRIGDLPTPIPHPTSDPIIHERLIMPHKTQQESSLRLRRHRRRIEQHVENAGAGGVVGERYGLFDGQALEAVEHELVVRIWEAEERL